MTSYLDVISDIQSLIKYSIQDVATVEIHRSVDMRIMTHQRIVALKCGVQLANTQNAQEADIAGL